MEQQANYLNVKTSDGQVLLSLYLNPGKGIVVENKLGSGNGVNSSRKGNDKARGNGRTQADGEPMTYPQKRFIFRILAQQGVEGDDALAQILKLGQVDSLTEISKLEASRIIENLLEENKGGANGISF
jgi:hypothetical protein